MTNCLPLRRALRRLAPLAVAALAAAGASAQAPKSGISWPKGQALPIFAAAQHLDVADIRNIPGDEQLMLASLQGIVNRREPRIYLLQPSEEGVETWLKDGLNVRYTMRARAWDILDTYYKEARGVVVYDPLVPDSINVATTLAGLKDALVVSPSLLPRLSAAPYSLPVVDDLRGRFRGRLDAYKWQFEKLWPQTTHRMLIAIAPTHGVEIRPTPPDPFQVLLRENRRIEDASNRAVRTVDLTPFLGKGDIYLRFQDSHPQDGWGVALHSAVVRADGVELGRFIPGEGLEGMFLYDADGSALSAGSGGHRFADNGRYFVYRGAAPEGTKRLEVDLDIWNQFQVSASNQKPPQTHREEPYAFLRDYAVANRAMTFWLDPNITEERELLVRIAKSVAPYTPYIGWFAQDVLGEFGGTELLARHGVYVLAADWFANLTVFSGARADNRPPKAPPTPRLENKIYVTYVMSEGDNLQYNQHRMRILWDDPARGRVPITWTTTPMLLESAPSILSYFQRTATPNDVLTAGPSGAGYIYPTPWPDRTFNIFARETKRYMDLTGMDVVYVLNRIDGVDIPLDAPKVRAFSEIVQPKGLLLGFGDSSKSIVHRGGMLESTVRGTGSPDGVRQALRSAAQGWSGETPRFLAIGVLAWSTTPSDLAAITDALGPEYKVVRGDHYFDLMREAIKTPAPAGS